MKTLMGLIRGLIGAMLIAAVIGLVLSIFGTVNYIHIFITVYWTAWMCYMLNQRII